MLGTILSRNQEIQKSARKYDLLTSEKIDYILHIPFKTCLILSSEKLSVQLEQRAAEQLASASTSNSASSSKTSSHNPLSSSFSTGLSAGQVAAGTSSVSQAFNGSSATPATNSSSARTNSLKRMNVSKSISTTATTPKKVKFSTQLTSGSAFANKPGAASPSLLAHNDECAKGATQQKVARPVAVGAPARPPRPFPPPRWGASYLLELHLRAHRTFAVVSECLKQYLKIFKGLFGIIMFPLIIIK